MNTGEIWRGVADRLEQMIEEQDEALREAPEDEHTYSVYLELVTHFRGEIEKLRKERDAIARDYDNERNAATIMRAELNEQLKIATNLGSKRWKVLNEIYEKAEKQNTNWCKRKAAEGLGLRGG